MVDTDGRPLGLLVHPASVQDRDGALPLLKVSRSRHPFAIIARHGLPPAGCRLEPLLNRHEFGDYRTLVLHIENELDEAVRAYADLTKNGLGSWIEAGFAPPVSYAGPSQRSRGRIPTNWSSGRCSPHAPIRTDDSRSPTSR